MNYAEYIGLDLNTVEGLAKAIDLPCTKIPDGLDGNCGAILNKYDDLPTFQRVDSCAICMAHRLLQPVNTKARIEISNDVSKWFDEFNETECASCSTCHYTKVCQGFGVGAAFRDYLLDKIPYEPEL